MAEIVKSMDMAANMDVKTPTNCAMAMMLAIKLFGASYGSDMYHEPNRYTQPSSNQFVWCRAHRTLHKAGNHVSN